MLKSTGHVLVKQYPVLPKYDFFSFFFWLFVVVLGVVPLITKLAVNL